MGGVEDMYLCDLLIPKEKKKNSSSKRNGWVPYNGHVHATNGGVIVKVVDSQCGRKCHHERTGKRESKMMREQRLCRAKPWASNTSKHGRECSARHHPGSCLVEAVGIFIGVPQSIHAPRPSDRCRSRAGAKPPSQ